MKILITGGAGFVGSRLAFAFRAQSPSTSVTVFDNLRRRGSELNVPLFAERGIHFVHGDIRAPHDFDVLDGPFDLFIEASAEPSVLAGVNSAPDYVLESNLIGTLHCLEFARRSAPRLIFLSTSRVYSIAPLKAITLNEAPTRFEISESQTLPGISASGIAEHFSVDTARSLYGATKLASEMMVQEYVAAYGIKAIINRCGVIAGPGQFGKRDQGVFTLWVAHHLFDRPLQYTGFGGTGKQVRDLLHPDDLFDLLVLQERSLEARSGSIYNVGGGRAISTSLLELTSLCRQVVGHEVPVTSDPKSSTVDIPLYISDSRKVSGDFAWAPKRTVETIVRDIDQWLTQNSESLRHVI
jgi:CDP-paratose 2-epimerase